MDPETASKPLEWFDCESGDAIQVAPASKYTIFLTVDDCDRTKLPTVSLTNDEAERVANAMLDLVRRNRS